MDSKELRKGNYVITLDNRIIKVRSVGEIGINIRPVNDGYEYDEWDEDINPIPLTPEWFLKAGFEYRKTDKADNYYFDDFRATYVTDGRFKGKRYLNFGNTLTFNDFWNCQYVHELQNLYFTLKKKELIFKI